MGFHAILSDSCKDQTFSVKNRNFKPSESDRQGREIGDTAQLFQTEIFFSPLDFVESVALPDDFAISPRTG